MPVLPIACMVIAALSAPAPMSVPPSAPSREADARVAQYCPYGFASICATAYGSCYLGAPLCRGAPCYCPTVYGPVWGIAQ